MAAMQQIIGRLDAVNPNRADLGVCVARLRPTGGCMDRERSRDLLRADFHVVVLCSAGSGDQVVDFGLHHHEPGSVLWIGPVRCTQGPPRSRARPCASRTTFSGGAHLCGAARRRGARPGRGRAARGELVGVTFGGPAARGALKEVLTRGADRAVLRLPAHPPTVINVAPAGCR